MGSSDTKSLPGGLQALMGAELIWACIALEPSCWFFPVHLWTNMSYPTPRAGGGTWNLPLLQDHCPPHIRCGSEATLAHFHPVFLFNVP